MTLKRFFESRLQLERGSSYTIEGIRDFLSRELVISWSGYDILRATVAADEYLVGVLREEVSRLSIP